MDDKIISLNLDTNRVTIKAVESDIALDSIESLATIIWTEHYTPIIGKDQVDYMLKNYQSKRAMQEQIKAGMEYYSILRNEIAYGYLAVRREKESLFLSKIYILREERGKGLGKTAMEFVVSRAMNLGCAAVELTVNKNNTEAIKAYQKLGFVNQGPMETDIGSGFIMDDYLMKKSLS